MSTGDLIQGAILSSLKVYISRCDYASLYKIKNRINK